MTSQEHLIDYREGTVKIAVSVITKKDWSSIEFQVGPAMKENLLLTRIAIDHDGYRAPEGELRRRWLHNKLDEWINENLKDEK